MSTPGVTLPSGIPSRVQDAVRRRMTIVGAKLTADINVVAGGQRGIDANTMIANVQAANRRNPWYLADKAKDACRILVRRMAADPALADAQLKRIGRLVLDGILENVANQANRGGKPFKALTAAYAAYKQRKFGFTVPILKATNDLLGGLRVVIERPR